MRSKSNVVIVGAGPYWLSLAAPLKAAGHWTRIFGKLMQLWREHVLPGMLLKPLGACANLFDPAANFAVPDYCANHDLPYDEETPIRSRSSFTMDPNCGYRGCELRQRFVPDVDQRNVISSATGARRSSLLALVEG
jgi:hypothetical protein